MKYKFMINAFDGEGGSAAAAPAAGSAGETAQIATGNEVTGVSSGEVDTAPDTGMSFEEYRKQHKDEVTKWFNKEFGARHRDYNQLKSRVEASNGIIDILANKYGIDAGDIENLAKAVADDDSLYEDKAMEAGLTVDQYKNLNRLESENRRLLAERRAAEAEQNMQRQLSEWESQAQNLKQIFPSFDLDTEVQNPEFLQMLESGMSMSRAFYALHGEEITTGAMQYTAQAVRQATAEDLATRRNRPKENGLSSNAAAKVSKDVHNMTKAERAAMAAQSLRAPIRF